MKMNRKAEISRKTAETEISLLLDLDQASESSIDTGCGFLNHMLTLFAKHGCIGLCVTCRGDTDVDYHHSVEDIAICLGQAKHRGTEIQRIFFLSLCLSISVLIKIKYVRTGIRRTRTTRCR